MSGDWTTLPFCGWAEIPEDSNFGAANAFGACNAYTTSDGMVCGYPRKADGSCYAGHAAEVKP